MNDGAWLEKLVASVEERCIPAGLNVTTRVKRYDESGLQVAEFDIVVSGKVGTTDFSWLIECRDRPSDGAAPSAWIEQLVGRRDRFNFNKVTAVSTSGFSSGARSYAQSAGIELREVNSFEPGSFDWIQIIELDFFNKTATLIAALFVFDDVNAEKQRAALARLESAERNAEACLRSTSTGQLSRCEDAFLGAVQSRSDDEWPAMSESDDTINVVLDVTYSNDANHFVVDVDTGPVRVRSIQFRGTISRQMKRLPMIRAAEYRMADATLISQSAVFAPMDTGLGQFTLEFHNLADKGVTEVLLRRVDPA